MIKKILQFLFPCRFNEPKCIDKKMGCICGKKPKAPEAAKFEVPEASRGIDTEAIDIIRSQVGKQAGTPEEFGISSRALQDLLQFQPDETAFQLPIDEIQQALAAQQQIQKEQFLQEVRPLAAAQGQLDSTGFTNRIGDFIQQQQAQSLGTSADLLTQQALQDLAQRQQLNQFLPQFQSQVAGQLAGLGGQISDLERFNLQLPFQTTIPAFQQQFQLALGQGGQEIAQQNLQFGADLQNFQQQQQQRQQLISGASKLGLSVLTGGDPASGLAALTGGGSSLAGFGGSGVQGLQSGVGGGTGGSFRLQPFGTGGNGSINKLPALRF